MQAVQHARQARLNETFAAVLQSQTSEASLVLLPLLGLVFAAMGPPPLTMADLLRPPALAARPVAIALVAAAATCSVACLAVSRTKARRWAADLKRLSLMRRESEFTL